MSRMVSRGIHSGSRSPSAQVKRSRRSGSNRRPTAYKATCICPLDCLPAETPSEPLTSTPVVHLAALVRTTFDPTGDTSHRPDRLTRRHGAHLGRPGATNPAVCFAGRVFRIDMPAADHRTRLGRDSKLLHYVGVDPLPASVPFPAKPDLGWDCLRVLDAQRRPAMRSA
jgi:hypothetical protein